MALIEKDKLGGTCLHRGCIPTKALLHAAEVADQTRESSQFGIKAELLGIDVPGRVQSGAGVFDQTDLVIDEWLALRFSRILAGVYFEQRRIDRGTSLGVIGSPASGIGVLLEPWFTASGRTRARVSYARYSGGSLRLAGSDSGPPLETGWSLRAWLRHQFTSRWGLQAEYSDVKLELEEVAPTLGFFDHRQSTLSLGAVVSF